MDDLATLEIPNSCAAVIFPKSEPGLITRRFGVDVVTNILGWNGISVAKCEVL